MSSQPEHGEGLPPRFWEKVQVDAVRGCWLWMASCNHGGYPQLVMPPDLCKPKNAARIAYECLVGPLPARLDWHASRTCAQKRCVNPAHIDLSGELASASSIARALQLTEERVAELAREGLVPSHVRGSQHRYRLSDVAAAVASLDLQKVNGVLYRATSTRGRQVRLREAEKGTGFDTCVSCRRRLAKSEFPPKDRVRHCRSCRRTQHRVEREQLSDNYVKDQLAQKTGLKAKDMPSALVEAHRAHLQVTRLIRGRRQ